MKVSLTPEQENGVTTLAQMVQKELKKEKCSGAACAIVIMNFALPSGKTCPACFVLSDLLADALGGLPEAPNVISRTNFISFMDRERIPSRYLQQHDALHWITRQMQATGLVFGVLEQEGDSLQIKAQLMLQKSAGIRTLISREIIVKIPIGNFVGALEERDSFHLLPKRDVSQFDVPPVELSKQSKKDIKHPDCFYAPNPPYTQAAREVGLSGSVLLEVVVTVDGKVIEPRIVRGLPFGLNEASMDTLKKWRCKPATRDGTPLPIILPIEVTFHFY